MEKGGAKLARRLSGGGAVFHDAGNLNFAFLMPRREYNDKAIFNVVIKALNHCGVRAGVMGKNSLAVNGRKVSGNAFCYRRENVLHHGTLLVSTDLEKMNRYLTSAHRGIRSRAIGSNPAPVVNLRDISDAITVPRMSAVLAETAAAEWGQQIMWGGDEMFDQKVLESVEKKYASWEWRFGMTPQFEVEMSWRFNWGEARVELRVEKGVIQQSQVDFAGDYRRLASMVGQVLVGTRLCEKDVVDCLQMRAATFRKDDAVEFARWLVGS
jgi:lipoate-protein ligase A